MIITELTPEQEAYDRPRRGVRYDRGDKTLGGIQLPSFVDANNLKPFIEEGFGGWIHPLKANLRKSINWCNDLVEYLDSKGKQTSSNVMCRINIRGECIMAYFEEALAGMRKGEKWRMEHWELEEWISFEDRGMGGIAYFSGRNLEKQLPDMEICKCITGDWERYEEPNKSLTFEEAIALLDTGQDIYIDAPCDSLSHYLHGSVVREPLQDVLLDLAERRGWKITRNE